jgi:hypothetical protein
MKNTSREKKNSDDLNKKQQDYSFLGDMWWIENKGIRNC